MTEAETDQFPCGLMSSDLDSRKITYANHYIASLLACDLGQIEGVPLENILTKASLIFMDSYVYPKLLEEGEHTELQLFFKTSQGDRIPVIANIRGAHKGTLHWSIMSAVEHDKMYQELIETRDQLQRYAKKLKQMASTDELTGLLNRRAVEERLDNVLNQSRRAATPLTLLLIDIDHFKKINDQYGHLEGDRVLAEVSTSIKSTLRNVDLGARWGGEEFLVVLYATDLSGAVEVSSRIHNAVNTIKFNEAPVQVSIGVAEIDLSSDSTAEAIESALHTADEALYRAKSLGRNRTEPFKV